MPDGGDWKALYSAARGGNVSEIRSWLIAGLDPNSQHAEFGTTALIAAAENGHLEAVKVLVEGGADPSVRSEWEGTTAAEAAAENGHSAVVSWLRAAQNQAES